MGQAYLEVCEPLRKKKQEIHAGSFVQKMAQHTRGDTGRGHTSHAQPIVNIELNSTILL